MRPNVGTTSIPSKRETEAVDHAWVLRSHQSNRYAWILNLKRDLLLRASDEGVSLSELIRKALRQYVAAS